MGQIVNFFLSPVGKYVAIGLALVVWTVYQREQAATKARDSCQAEQLQKTVDEISRQRDAARRALDEARKQEETTAQELAKLEADLENINKNNPDSGCRVPADALERLRNIR